ncbi:MAG: NRDE family protein [Gammaproteobacteria bacterium]|nr:NRDE family protein [Gammaproteobacteria bacterium]MXY66363.1 NRDE family protein [Gammaproteobacteria bacterium]MYG66350.1 NRDE family protein [Gammaproteobacteria bacterium]MYH90992.1 NRDE family protein [Gammaproteobacteria bacterium]
MCILFVALNQHPRYPLIIAANRDEYHARPSLSMHWWEDRPRIFAGRDLSAGGTWLGINRDGAFAAVTNFRTGEDHRADGRSRGELAVRYLESSGTPADFHGFLRQHHHEYNPFNLVYGDRRGLHTWGYDNPGARALDSGFHSVSNGPMDTIWPKMSRGVTGLARQIRDHPDIGPETLLPLMLDTTPAPDGDLPGGGPDLERERQLSPIYIRGEEYGTRTTTILLFREDGIGISEYEHGPERPATSANRFHVPDTAAG